VENKEKSRLAENVSFIAGADGTSLALDECDLKHEEAEQSFDVP
jgi:hypothetical protein